MVTELLPDKDHDIADEITSFALATLDRRAPIA
jgi:hypothetical protein